MLTQQASGLQWTTGKIALSLALFIAAGLAEIAGGWLVWQAVRGRFMDKAKPFLQNKKAIVSAAAGSCCLVGYGILPTAQPMPAFGRIYAVYGGFFVALSYAWGWLVDGEKPDQGRPPLPNLIGLETLALYFTAVGIIIMIYTQETRYLIPVANGKVFKFERACH